MGFVDKAAFKNARANFFSMLSKADSVYRLGLKK